jgi:hypothetical protein
MKIKLSLTAPEYAPLIVRYDEFFHENHAYELDWNYDVLPRVGDYISFSFIKDLIKEHVDVIKLPEHWAIVDIKWNKINESVMPTLFIVGK